MLINSQTAQQQAVLNAAYALCAAARTAPKACGIDNTDSAILTGEDKDSVAREMRRLSEQGRGELFARDAANVDASDAVVLVGVGGGKRGLGEICKLCGFDDCAACEAAGGCCVFNSMDLGIALGSAVSLAADLRIDNRLMFTIGQAAASLGLLGEYKLIIGIPLASAGKSPFFDRK